MELQLNQLSDEDLVAASRSGDKKSYAALVRRHARRIYAICYGMLGEAADSEDLFQETFVKGMTKLNTLRDDAQFGRWISQIARNLCRDHWRNRRRRQELLAARPEQRPVNAGEFDDLHDALARLPEEYRLPLMLFYFDGKNSETIARELNLSKGGACTRLFRARNELRKLLETKEDKK
jgi:RNA polymerase sigma-70 factor (ECF subfamily)